MQFSQQFQVGHMNSLHWPIEICLVWKGILYELLFIHHYIMPAKFANVNNITLKIQLDPYIKTTVDLENLDYFYYNL